MAEDKTGAFISGFLWGAIAGFVIGVLYAPRPGAETREILKEKTIEFSGKAKDLIDEAKARGRDLLTGKGVEIQEESEGK
jgi:gas vesicle protein